MEAALPQVESLPGFAECIDARPIGTITWAYGVPLHMTHGPPLPGSVGIPSSAFVSGTISMTCDPEFATH